MKSLYEKLTLILNKDTSEINVEELKDLLTNIVLELKTYLRVKKDIGINFVYLDEAKNFYPKAVINYDKEQINICIGKILEIKTMQIKNKEFNALYLTVYLISRIIHELEIARMMEQSEEEGFSFEKLLIILDNLTIGFNNGLLSLERECEKIAYTNNYDDTFEFLCSINHKLDYILAASDSNLLAQSNFLKSIFNYYNVLPFNFYINKFNKFDEVWKYICSHGCLGLVLNKYPMIKVIYNDDGTKKSFRDITDAYFNSSDKNKEDYMKLLCFNIELLDINEATILKEKYGDEFLILLENIYSYLEDCEKKIDESWEMLVRTINDKKLDSYLLVDLHIDDTMIKCKFGVMRECIIKDKAMVRRIISSFGLQNKQLTKCNHKES